MSKKNYYTGTEVKNLITKQGLELFGKWIYGQTCPLIKGKCAYYKHDVEDFLEQLYKTKLTVIDW